MGNKTNRPPRSDKPRRDSSEEIEVFAGSGNVFADMGLPNPQERAKKADIANRIEDLLEADGLSSEQAAQIMKVTTEDVSNIVRGRLKNYSLESLFHCLSELFYYRFTALDQNLEDILNPPRVGKESSRLPVRAPA